MTTALDAFAPTTGERAVLSALMAKTPSDWRLVSGSLLTVQSAVAFCSTRRWQALQPQNRDYQDVIGGFDIGPVFCVEPFPGLRAVRAIVEPADWTPLASSLTRGEINLPTARCRVDIECWSSTVFLGVQGVSPAHDTIHATERPVNGVVAKLRQPPIPHSEDTWQFQTQPGLPRGIDLAQMSRERRLLHWPQRLLGINWLGLDKHAPPSRLTIGRTLHEAWIADVRPDFETGQLRFGLAWDETRIDPLGCTMVFRAEDDGMLLFTYHLRISDLPGNLETSGASHPEARRVPWNERTLGVNLPRGPRRADWAVSLFSSDGRLLDDRPLVPRIERISFSLHLGGPDEPAARESVIGDSDPPPTEAERDAAVEEASRRIQEARKLAAGRRLSTSGELKRYLRWRFSCRDGELLLLDTYLLAKRTWSSSLDFLAELDRPVRAMCGEVSIDAQKRLEELPEIVVRRLPMGMRTLHDRIWLVGETGIAVGASVNGLDAGPLGRASTLSELPFGDVANWRNRFEEWWTDDLD